MASIDGAHLGLSVEQALTAVLGGPQPTAEERQSVEQMRADIMASTLADCGTYDGVAKYCAKLILQFVEQHGWPDGDLYGALGPSVTDEDREQCLMQISGFVWGWAENAVRLCCELPPVPNPAIVTISM